ncbi:hypothetical protein [Variovorax sp. dw_954]|uniref:hypothetical protein n=1 Tax=Variovorax sp. dw_954 TaxID=2720078 RepID=UPI001BD51551|nr:hypothetical protein [Variovorax sp. dw_954]
MSTYERALTAGEQREFNRYAAAGNQMIGGERDAPPTRIVAAIHASVDRHQRKHAGQWAPRREGEERRGNAEAARALATVWGDQLVRVFGWEWVCVMFEGEEHYVVVQPSRSLAIFATEYIEACLDLETMDCAIKAAFDQLRSDVIPPQAAWSYTSAMQLVSLAASEPARAVPAHAKRWAADRLGTIIRKSGALADPSRASTPVA